MPQGYVVTVKSISEYLEEELSVTETARAIKFDDPEIIKPTYKVVKSNGELSEYLSGIGETEQRKRLERNGVEFIGQKVNMEERLYF